MFCSATLQRVDTNVLKYQEILLAPRVQKSKLYRELPSYYMAPPHLHFYLKKDFAGQVTVIYLHA